jgi:tRNA threonylcarbamoyladenosine biosynthesis protein TsaB
LGVKPFCAALRAARIIRPNWNEAAALNTLDSANGARAFQEETAQVNLLALETSGTAGSVAAFHDTVLLAEIELDPLLRSARSLAPALQALLAQVGWSPGEVELVAVATGPGSFTGLRVGVATARAFAYAVGADVLGIGTLDALARAALEHFPDALSHSTHLIAAADALRGQWFAADYEPIAQAAPDRAPHAMERSIGLGWRQSAPPRICRASEHDTLAVGAILVTANATIADRLAKEPSGLAPLFVRATAATVGRLAIERAGAGQRDDLWQLVPIYLRASAAEERRALRDQV